MSKAIFPPIQICQLTILKIGLSVPLKDQQLLSPAYVQPEQSVSDCSWDHILVFSSEAYVVFWFVSEIGRMLICVFRCCNKSHPHKFIAMLAICGFNFPICPSGPIHSTCLVLCFTWVKVPIPRNWIFISWRGQSGCQDFGEIMLHPCLCLINLQSQCPIFVFFGFGLWSFIEAWQNTCFMVSSEFF